MLQPIKNVLNYKILATDGEIGSVSDLIVDDQELKLRYLVIDTGNWRDAAARLLPVSVLLAVGPRPPHPALSPAVRGGGVYQSLVSPGLRIQALAGSS